MAGRKMRLKCECFYCGKTWEETIYMDPKNVSLRCSDCGDQRIKVRAVDSEKSDPFGYRFSPPFPEPLPTLEEVPRAAFSEDYWLDRQKKNLGEEKFRQEYMGEFPPIILDSEDD